MAAINILLLLAALALLLPSLVLVAEVLAGALPSKVPAVFSGRRARIAVIVPAHDEASGISATVHSIRQQLSSEDRLLVVADNCSDATGSIAASLGAEVVERSDLERRGKAYAVAFGIRHLAVDPPDVVIVIDADCELSPGCLYRIGQEAFESGTPVQAHNRVLFDNQKMSPQLAHRAFAFKVKNTLRPTGLRNLGLPCQLMGTGMALPWRLVELRNLGSGELAEDLVWGLQFAKDGHAPRFCPEVSVTSQHPNTVEGQATQRARWETGHLTTIYRHVPRLLLDAIKYRNMPLFTLALDAAVPPLALHALCVGALAFLTALWFLAGGSGAPLVLAAATIAALTTALAVAWAKVGREHIAPADMLAVPVYALSKVPLYAQILLGRQGSWVRTKRDRE